MQDDPEMFFPEKVVQGGNQIKRLFAHYGKKIDWQGFSMAETIISLYDDF